MTPRACALIAALVVACRGENNGSHAQLGGESVARVGDVTIQRELLSAVAQRQGVLPRAVIGELVSDTVAAEAARAQRLPERPEVAWALTAARARIVTDRLFADAHARGPATDAEITEVTDKRWRDYDVPERARVVHAVVLRKDVRDPALVRRVAEVLRAAVSRSTDAATFRSAAGAIDKQGLDVRVEDLPTFTLDGRLFEQEGALDPAFTAGAFALSVGAVSQLVDTPFGLHVILLLERYAPFSVPLAERRVALAAEVYQRRVRAEYAALLERARARAPVSIDTGADELMARVSTK